MVLSASSSNAQPGPNAWLDDVTTALSLADAAMLVLVEAQQPAQLGALARQLFRIAGDLIVTSNLSDLVDGPLHRTVIFCPDAAATRALNLQRPIFARNALRTVVFCGPEHADSLARDAPDFFSWISHRVVAPVVPPPYAVRGLRLALCRRARFTLWHNGESDSDDAGGQYLQQVFDTAFPGRSLKHVTVTGPYPALVEAANPQPRQWCSWDMVTSGAMLRRLRWAHGEAARRGRSILRGNWSPEIWKGEEPAAVDGRVAGCAVIVEPSDALRRHRRPGLLAALLDLEPDAIRCAEQILAAGAELPTFEQLADAPDPGVLVARAARAQGIDVAAETASKSALAWRAFGQSRTWQPGRIDRIARQHRWRDLAEMAWAEGDPAQTLIWGGRWLKHEPCDAAKLLLARAQLARWSFEEGQAMLSDCALAEAGILRTVALTGLARYDEARATLNALPPFADDVTASEALVARAFLCRVVGAHDDAVAAASTALDLARRTGDAVALLAAYEEYALLVHREGGGLGGHEVEEIRHAQQHLPQAHWMRASSTLLLHWLEEADAASDSRKQLNGASTDLECLLGRGSPRHWWCLIQSAGPASQNTSRPPRSESYLETLHNLDRVLGSQNLLALDLIVSWAELAAREGRRDVRDGINNAIERIRAHNLDSDWLHIRLQLGIARTLLAEANAAGAISTLRPWLPKVRARPTLAGPDGAAQVFFLAAQAESALGNDDAALALLEEAMATDDHPEHFEQILSEQAHSLHARLEQALARSRRLWVPRGGHIPLDAGGYLLDDDDHRRMWGLRTFEQLNTIPCLVLLGEPGSGKTFVLNAAVAAARVRGEASQSVVSLVTSEETDIAQALARQPAYRQWVEGQQDLALFLDSRGAGPSASSMHRLIDVLRAGPSHRLIFRVSWRTSRYRQDVADALEWLWNPPKRVSVDEHSGEPTDHAVGVYELAPLRRVDVARIAGGQADDFVAQVDALDLQPYARHPATLELFLRLHLAGGQLPESRWGLYQAITAQLCVEREAATSGEVPPQRQIAAQTLAVAARAAALVIFGGDTGLFVGRDARYVPERTLPLFAIEGGHEPAAGETVEVTRSAAIHALTTNLFVDGGGGVVQFARDDYGHFMAAHYLHARATKLEQLRGLLLSHEPGGVTVAATRDVTTLLADVHDDLFEHLLAHDPAAALRTDLQGRGDRARQRLTASLLQHICDKSLLDTAFDRARDYRKLKHSALAQQLEPCIRNTAAFFIARRTAIDIAEACGCTSLGDALADVALDERDHPHVREQAVHAVVEIGSSEHKLRLRPLAHGERGPDPSDQLRGNALRALWPEHMDGNELLECLVPAKRDNYIGSYRVFLHLVARQAEQLPIVAALTWARAQLPALDDWRGTTSALSELVAAIIRHSWQHHGDPAVLELLVDVLQFKLARHQPLFADDDQPEALASTAVRRELVMALLVNADEGNAVSYWSVESAGLAPPEDLQWYVERLLDERTPIHARPALVALLKGMMLHRGAPDQADVVEQILLASEAHEDVRAALAPWLSAISLDSDVARQSRSREDDADEKEPASEDDRDGPLTEEGLRAAIAEQLDRGEADESDAFWYLLQLLSVEPPSRNFDQHFEVGIERLNGWQGLGSTEQRRVIALAKRYLLSHVVDAAAALAPNSLSPPEQAGYRALRIVYRHERLWVERLPAAVWQRWAAAVVRFAMRDWEDRTAAIQIAALCYRNAPEETLWSLGILLAQDGFADRHIATLDAFHAAWDEQLAALLLLKLQDERWGPKAFGSLLDHLLEHHCAAARAYARDKLAAPLPENAAERLRVRAAAQALLLRPLDDDWSAILQLLEIEPAFARDVVLGTAVGRDLRAARRQGERSWRQTAASNLGRFQLWLERSFPHSEDAERSVGAGFRLVTPRMELEDMRDGILAELRSRGTAEALAAVRELERNFPDVLSFTFARIDAQQAYRDNQWRPLAPHEVLRLGTVPPPGEG